MTRDRYGEKQFRTTDNKRGLGRIVTAERVCIVDDKKIKSRLGFDPRSLEINRGGTKSLSGRDMRWMKKWTESAESFQHRGQMTKEKKEKAQNTLHMHSSQKKGR